MSSAYCTIDYIITHLFHEKFHELLQFVVSILFLAIGFYCHVTGCGYYGLERVFSYYILFWAGHIMSKTHFLKSLSSFLHIIVLILALLSLIALKQYGKIELASNFYTNPLFLCLSSFAGWSFVFEISNMAQKNKFTARLFSCIGQNTLSIMILHFLC